MPRRRDPFLTARWTNLALITYDVEPALLDPILPPDCIADTRDGRAFVSLVAFDFLDTRVLGIRWPTFVNFPEINLRFYVRDRETGQRGVSFVRELVPQRFVAWVARVVYNEPYLAVPMTSNVELRNGRIDVRHAAIIDRSENVIHVSARDETFRPAPDSIEHFFKEHAWGFGRTRGGRLLRYEVAHPEWDVYREPVIEQLDWDFGAIYGERWAFLSTALPYSLVLAAGSEIAVYPKGAGL